MSASDRGQARFSGDLPASASALGLRVITVWRRLSQRERRALGVAGLLLSVALTWWIAVLPAWSTLRLVERQRPALERQWQQMQAQQVQARSIQTQTRLTNDEARRLLEAASGPLAPALQLTPAGDRITVTVKALRGDVLAQWLAQVQSTARLAPTEVRLRRSAPGSWDGTLVFPLTPS